MFDFSWEQSFRMEMEDHSPEFLSVEYQKEMVIAVIDSGLDFKNELLKNSVPSKYHTKLKSLNFSKNEYFDTDGHGSHVTSVILGLMPKAKILPLKFEMDKKGNQEEINKALRFAIDQKVDLINLSLYGREYDQAEKELLVEASDKGIIIVVAAGNEGINLDRTKAYPSSYKIKNMIVVGNKSETQMRRESSSNYGSNTVDFFIRGSKVLGIFPDCNRMYMTGTSLSAPAMAAIIAHHKAQNPSLKLEVIVNHLKNIALKTPGHTLSRYGYLELGNSLNIPISIGSRELANHSNKVTQ